ncbi:uncharacterized protein LOC117341747 [Pecten maximus]|uniref:uncharacterized protein LOC117341747 n=1 Tax=Pecten maximus TaxID=6579 RepID=UPI001458990F|nr:uncharacterized protein LOC117341747 [Pecten maximus]
MSHNGKYYVRKVPKNKPSSTLISAFFSKRQKLDVSVDAPSNDETECKPTDVGDNNINKLCDEIKSVTGDSDGANICKQSETVSVEVAVQTPVAMVASTTTTPLQKKVQLRETRAEIDFKPAHSNIDRRRFDMNRYTVNYPWLYHTSEKGYLCKLCELTYGSNCSDSSSMSVISVTSPFISPGLETLGTHPSRLLDKHANSTPHLKASKINAEVKVKIGLKQKMSVLEQLSMKNESDLKAEKERNASVLKKLFQSIYFIIRKKWAQTNFEDFVRFVASLGVEDIARHIEIAPPQATYLSVKTATELIELIGENIEQSLLDSLRKAPFYSLLADESTDEANKTQLSVFCRWYHESHSNFTDHFMGLVEVQKTDSATLMDVLHGFLIAKGIPIEKCRFVAFDGTNSMSGIRTGLQRRFRNYAPKSLYINCRCHRLALCLKHLMKTFPLLVEVDEALLAIWKLFKYSPQRFAVLQDVQVVYGMDKLMLIRAATTRWLSHGKACVRFIERYESVLDALDQIYQQKREPEVFGLRSILVQKNVVAMICVLSDVLKPLNHLSLYLQKTDVVLCNVEEKVKATVTDLEVIKETYLEFQENNQIGDQLYVSRLSELLLIINERTDLQRRHRGHLENLDIKAFIKDVAVPFIDSLIGEINDAFYMHPVFDAFRKALDPSMIEANASAVDLQNHGKEALTVLCGHYGEPGEDIFQGHVTRCERDLDPDATEAEYCAFKHQIKIMKRMKARNPQPSNSNEGDQVNNLLSMFLKVSGDPVLQESFPMMCKLLYLVNIIPASTASVERSFSQMALLKTPMRSRLSCKSINAIMRINIEGASTLTEYELELVQNFKLAKDRHLSL